MLASFMHLPAGDFGTFITVAQMRALSRTASYDPVTRQTAVKLVAGTSGKDGRAQAYIIRSWLQDHTSFLRDPHGTEALHDPKMLLRTILTGNIAHVDCDDVAMLAAALGLAIGLRARFVLLAFGTPSSPFRHVFAELGDPSTGRWYEMDITRPAQDLPQRPTRAQATEV